LTFDLSPPVLYELGLEAALESLMERMQKLHDLRFEFVDDNQPKPLSEDLAVLLYRAVQEVLVNIVKHAQARTAKTSIEKDDKKVRVTIRDDGVGFDVTEIESHVDREGKFGLFSIRERLDHLGGHVEIATKPGQGTQVTLVVPLGPDF
jgi:signal transduction histidine kinase